MQSYTHSITYTYNHTFIFIDTHAQIHTHRTSHTQSNPDTNTHTHRLDAQKFVCETRRAVAERAENIGIWFKILEMLAQLAVISNVCMCWCVCRCVCVCIVHMYVCAYLMYVCIMYISNFSNASSNT